MKWLRTWLKHPRKESIPVPRTPVAIPGRVDIVILEGIHDYECKYVLATDTARGRRRFNEPIGDDEVLNDPERKILLECIRKRLIENYSLLKKKTPQHTDYGKRVRDFRVSRAMTQEQLAEKMEVTRDTVGEWESGWTKPTEENQQKLIEMGLEMVGVQGN